MERWSISRLGSQCSTAFECNEYRGSVSHWHGRGNERGNLRTRYHLCVVHIMMIPRNLIISIVNDQFVHENPI